jgi:protein TonB
MSLLSGAPDRDKAFISGVLMVNLADATSGSSITKKSLATPQKNAFASKESLSSTQAEEASALAGIQDAGHLSVGASRQAIYRLKPHYPLVSKKLREQGLVVVRLCVNQQGIVDGVDVYKSSGFPSLDHSALKALAQWRFTPIAFNSAGLSLQCFQTPVQFTLEG